MPWTCHYHVGQYLACGPWFQALSKQTLFSMFLSSFAWLFRPSPPHKRCSSISSQKCTGRRRRCKRSWWWAKSSGPSETQVPWASCAAGQSTYFFLHLESVQLRMSIIDLCYYHHIGTTIPLRTLSLLAGYHSWLVPSSYELISYIIILVWLIQLPL